MDDIQFLLPVSVDSVMEFTATVVYSQDLFIVVQVNWNDVNTQKIEGSGCVQVIEFLVTFFFFSDGQVDAFKVNPTSSYRSKTNVLSYIFQAPKVVEYIRQVSIGTRTEFLSIFFFLIPFWCAFDAILYHIFISDFNILQHMHDYFFFYLYFVDINCPLCLPSAGHAQWIWWVCPIFRGKKKHGKLFFIWPISWH